MRTCKKCGKTKEYNYFTRDEFGRSLHKDEDGYLWHGKQCGVCFTEYVKSKSGKKPLSVINCIICNKEFKQKTIRQKKCNNHS
jgi:hypothetical protein